MGVACQCHKIECEEETVSRILSTMHLSEIETKSAYIEFSKCINKDEGYLDFFLFGGYLSKVSGNNNYKNAQISFFDNLRKLDSRQQNIKRIGSIIIYLSKGTKYQKIDLLYDHYMKYYTKFDEKTIKEFISDIIDTNTDNCMQSFRENLGYEVVKNMSEIYKSIRKRQLLFHIYNNFQKIKIKYFHHPNFMKTERLNNSIDIDNTVGIELNPERDDITETYERYNKNQCDQICHYSIDVKKLTDEEKVVKEFIELAFNYMSGEYIRNWLYEDYLKEKTYENVCI